jgi:sulfide dehydrogenase [flavocytochrome c] flavoprotein subunit
VKWSRRKFIKLSGTTLAAAAAGNETFATDTPDWQRRKPVAAVGRQAELPKASGPRAVVVGGGWSGLTVAKYLKREDPSFDVVLIEKRSLFMSCPISNLWLADVVGLEFMQHSYLDAARNSGYIFLNATVIDVDRVIRRVYTERGYVDYDYLVLAPGIDYEYESIGVNEPETVVELGTRYPAGFIPGSEHLSIKNKLARFERGVFLLSVPSGNYRCLPAPYERACMIAAVFKKKRIKGKVLLLDANPDITIKRDGFHAAFGELYKGVIEYNSGAGIKSVNIASKTVDTEFDSFAFDDAAIYPRVRAAKLIETLGLVNPESLQKEANIDVLRYNVIGDDRVYVSGDSRPMPFSKSGNTANTEGKFVAKVIAARARGKEIEWESPHTVCYSAVNPDPLLSMSVDLHYKFDARDKSFSFDKVHMVQQWNQARGVANLEWARALYHDMFS